MNKPLTAFNAALLILLLAFIGLIVYGVATSGTASADVERDRTRATDSGYVTTPTVVADGAKIIAEFPLFVPENVPVGEAITQCSIETGNCFVFVVRVQENGEPRDVRIEEVDPREVSP